MSNKKALFNSLVEPLLDQAYLLCKEHGMSFVALVHAATEEEPTLTHGIGALFEDAPQTLIKVLKLVNERPVVEEHALPDSECDNSSVNS